MNQAFDPLQLLSRKDKWFLGGGKGAIYAPPFPKHLTTPGFCDECHFADLRIPRLFSVLMVDAAGKPLRLRGEVVDWRPDRLLLRHTAPGVVIQETRCVTEGQAWAAQYEVLVSPGPLNFFQWSLLDVKEPGFGAPWNSVTQADVDPGGIHVEWLTAWPAELEPDRTAVEHQTLTPSPSPSGVRGESPMLPTVAMHLSFGGSVPRHSWTVNLAQRHDEAPLYELSMLPEKFRNGELPCDYKVEVGPPPVKGLLHCYQQFVIEPGEELVLACGSGLSAEDAGESLRDALAPRVIDRSEEAWRVYFAGVPQFRSSDPWLTAAYWYRWYGLRLNTVDVPDLPIQTSNLEPRTFSPFITEGIGFFRNFITYSAQAHLREVAWMHDPTLALGILENLTKIQREDGSFPGHNYSARPPRDFYHADFATGLRLVRDLHNVPVRAEIRDALGIYARYFLTERWSSTGGALVLDQNETGQEYMRRYQFASETADQWSSFRVVGVDATTYLLQLLGLLDELEPSSPEQYPDSPDWGFYWGICNVGLQAMFDRISCFFCDELPEGGSSPARPATGFYPLMFVSQRSHELHECVGRWLLNPKEFWLPKGFPATAASDPTFSPEGEWKDKRLNCPWNGRSWPMVNSHLVDALANVARLLDGGEGGLRRSAAEALMKTIKLMFHDDDPARPNSYEHYNPITGTPALHRGYDDYMHSWIVDLIMRLAVGVKPGEDDLHPLPMDTEWIECTDIPHPKGRMHVRIDKGVVTRLEIT